MYAYVSVCYHNKKGGKKCLYVYVSVCYHSKKGGKNVCLCMLVYVITIKKEVKKCF